MKRALMISMLGFVFVLGACGKDDENNPSGTNATTGTNGSNSGTNAGTTGTNSSQPAAGDCEWGEFLAACGGGAERDYGARAVGCREYYEPSPVESVQQATLCEDEIWDEMQKCSNSGLSGRRPAGCCFEVDPQTNLYSRHCIYNDPAEVETTAEEAETACVEAGFCWQPYEMML